MSESDFCTDQHKFSGPYARRWINFLRDYVICDELTGDFGNGAGGDIAGNYARLLIYGKLIARHFETIATASANNGSPITLAMYGLKRPPRGNVVGHPSSTSSA
jgi:hypothetical protein